mgnify:CR=1 FL=1
MAFREQIEIEWKSLYTAPRPQGNDFYSKPFLVLGACAAGGAPRSPCYTSTTTPI